MSKIGTTESAGGGPYQRRTFRASDLSRVNGRTHGRASTHTLVHPLNTCLGDSLNTAHCTVYVFACMTGAAFIPVTNGKGTSCPIYNCRGMYTCTEHLRTSMVITHNPPNPLALKRDTCGCQLWHSH